MLILLFHELLMSDIVSWSTLNDASFDASLEAKSRQYTDVVNTLKVFPAFKVIPELGS